MNKNGKTGVDERCRDARRGGDAEGTPQSIGEPNGERPFCLHHCQYHHYHFHNYPHTGGCAHILTKSGHGDPNHNYCDIHNIHNIHNIHYIQGIQNIVQVILEEHNRQLESQLHKLKGILEV